MEAKNLMIGDWVQIDNGEKGKVVGLDYYNNGKHEIVIRNTDNLIRYSEEEYVKPIPLTPTILLTNRFNKLIGLHSKRERLFELSHLSHLIKASFDYDIETIAIGDCYYIRVLTHCYDYDLDMNTISEHRCIAVHELQHALRLCGLTELADNIKID